MVTLKMVTWYSNSLTLLTTHFRRHDIEDKTAGFLNQDYCKWSYGEDKTVEISS